MCSRCPEGFRPAPARRPREAASATAGAQRRVRIAAVLVVVAFSAAAVPRVAAEPLLEATNREVTAAPPGPSDVRSSASLSVSAVKVAADTSPSDKATGSAAKPRILRVAADPNNLPFSNDRLEGFENKLVALVARELGASVEYTWRAQRRGFFRETITAGNCDIVAGVPKGFDRLLTTRPYYRSTYGLVYRKGRRLDLRSLDDPRLRELTIGVQMIGDDFNNTPPAHALSRRGIIQNVRGYTVYGDYRERDPPARIIEAVATGEIDVAIVWGPLAGYFATRQAEPLEWVPLPPKDDVAGQPFTFAISMGVRKTEPALRSELNAILERKQPEIDALLAEFGLPRVEAVTP